MDENTDLSKQYQDILDHYSKELSETKTNTPTEKVNTPAQPPVLPQSSAPSEPITPTEQSAAFPEPIAPIEQSVVPPEPPPVVATSSNNFFKYLFFISLIIFLGVFGAVVYTLIKGIGNPSSISVPSITSSLSPTPAATNNNSSSICSLNDRQYQVGESFAAADGCNTCSCGADLTITCTQKACDATSSAATLRSQVEDWSSYSKSSTKLSWDKCEGESTISDSLKGMMSLYPVFTKKVNGVKLAYSSKLDFTSEDVAKFKLCETGNYYPIYTFADKILWASSCSAGSAPENSKCEDALTQIKQLYGYKN